MSRKLMFRRERQAMERQAMEQRGAQAQTRPQNGNSRPTAGLERLNLSLVVSPELREWAAEYARSRETKLSQLLVDYLVRLRRLESEAEKDLGVEQI